MGTGERGVWMGEPCVWGWVSIVYGFCVGRCGYVEKGGVIGLRWVVSMFCDGL